VDECKPLVMPCLLEDGAVLLHPRRPHGLAPAAAGPAPGPAPGPAARAVHSRDAAATTAGLAEV